MSACPDRCMPRKAETVQVSPRAQNLSRTAVALLPAPSPPAGTSWSLGGVSGSTTKPWESGANALISQTWPGWQGLGGAAGWVGFESGDFWPPGAG